MVMAKSLFSLLGFSAMIPWIAAGQLHCPEPQWKPGDGLAGTDGPVYASTVWDPDGPGPMLTQLVIGGQFALVESLLTGNIAKYEIESQTWSSFGSGTNERVLALAGTVSGDLYAGGAFSVAGENPAYYIARWTPSPGGGGSWGPVGGGVNAFVHALESLPSGDVIAGGAFTTAGSANAGGVAIWKPDVSTWVSMGAGVSGPQYPTVHALACLPNGDAIAGGDFTHANGIVVNHIARWDGAAWSPLGSGLNALVRSLKALPSGEIVVGGMFQTAGGVSANRIAKWNPTSGVWSPLGGGFLGDNVSVRSIARLPSDDLVVVGDYIYNAGGISVLGIARWNPSAAKWSGFGNTFISASTLAVLPGGELIAGGLSSWNESSGKWAKITKGNSGEIQHLRRLPDGDLIAGGSFSQIGGIDAVGIARQDHTSGEWASLGGPLNGAVYATTTLPNDDLIVGGTFNKAGNVGVSAIGKWVASTGEWSGLGSGLTGSTDQFPSPVVYALERLASGEVIATGHFLKAGGKPSAGHIARWNDATGNWSLLGSGLSGSFGYGKALATLNNGDLAVGGQFAGAGGKAANNIARWSPSTQTWSTFGSGMDNSVQSLAVLPNGNLVAGGWFLKRIASWNDATGWSSLGSGVSGIVTALHMPAGDDLFVGGNFLAAGGKPVSHIARWNVAKSAWFPLEQGVGSPKFQPWVNAIETDAHNDLVVGGDFLTASGKVSAYLARFGCPTPSCYADCDGSKILDIDDFVCFQTLYASADPQADCDESGDLDIDDFICFQTLFAIGC